ncbi:MAG: DUF4352 domain-containing protein [Chloroflexota bacterium]
MVPVGLAALVIGIAAPVIALQAGPDRVIVQKTDGSLFFIQDGLRYAVTPAPLTDEQIDALPLASIPADLILNSRSLAAGPERTIIEPSDTFGLDLTRPIPRGIICRCDVDRRGRISSFEVSIDEVLRDAWPLVREANRFNRAPNDSFSYFGVKVTMRYFTGPSDDAFQVSSTDFKLVGADRTLRQTAAIFEPEPRLSGSIYPGATVSGYLIYEIRKDEQAQVLLFETNFNGERGVWFALGGG